MKKSFLHQEKQGHIKFHNLFLKRNIKVLTAP